jgi:transposase
MAIDGPINGVSFQPYVDQLLVPELRAGDIVVMDINLGSHKGAGVRNAAKRTADGLRDMIGAFLPAFTPRECENFYAAAGYAPWL